MTHTKRNSYVLLFTLSIMTLITILTFQLMRNVFVGTNFDRTMINREHAEMLALGGINLAIAQLSPPKKKSRKETKDKIQKPSTLSKGEGSDKEKFKDIRSVLKRTLPHLNRWQVFSLNEKLDGIDGEIKFCMTSEDGKININEAFDFQKKEFKPIHKKLIDSLVIRGKAEKGQVLKQLTEFFKKRKQKIDDISELQKVLPELDVFFYEPPVRTEKMKDAQANTHIALQDLFTVWTFHDTVEPLFLSDAMCAVFNLRRPLPYDAERMKDKFKRIIDNFKSDTEKNTEQYWNLLKTIYTKKPLNLNEYKKIFSTTFEPKVYSVLSSGNVRNVEQRLLAIIEKEEPQKEARILKIYWL